MCKQKECRSQLLGVGKRKEKKTFVPFMTKHKPKITGNRNKDANKYNWGKEVPKIIEQMSLT